MDSVVAVRMRVSVLSAIFSLTKQIAIVIVKVKTAILDLDRVHLLQFELIGEVWIALQPVFVEHLEVQLESQILFDLVARLPCYFLVIDSRRRHVRLHWIVQSRIEGGELVHLRL